MKETVIFDVDGTIISGQSQMIFLNYLYKKNYISFFYYIRIILWFIFYKIGLVDNPKSIMKYAFIFVNGKSISEIELIVDDFFVTVLEDSIFPEVKKIIFDHQSHGREVILVSNAADVLIKKIASHLNISEFFSTKLEVINGIYTGNIAGDIIYGDNKVKILEKYFQSSNFSFNNSWAYTDHNSDTMLLLKATHAFAVNPTKKLRNIAIINKWPILNFKI